jgi:hypothetical protein
MPPPYLGLAKRGYPIQQRRMPRTNSAVGGHQVVHEQLRSAVQLEQAVEAHGRIVHTLVQACGSDRVGL